MRRQRLTVQLSQVINHPRLNAGQNQQSTHGIGMAPADAAKEL